MTGGKKPALMASFGSTETIRACSQICSSLYIEGGLYFLDKDVNPNMHNWINMTFDPF